MGRLTNRNVQENILPNLELGDDLILPLIITNNDDAERTIELKSILPDDWTDRCREDPADAKPKSDQAQKRNPVKSRTRIEKYQ